MFLDDIQWADPDTLEVLQDLLVGVEEIAQQQQGTGILFVGAYRDSEVEDDACHPLARCVRTISENIREGSDVCEISELYIANLDEADTMQLVADFINTELAEVKELTKLIYLKTGGNCFYTLQALRHVYHQGILYVSTDSRR